MKVATIIIGLVHVAALGSVHALPWSPSPASRDVEKSLPSFGKKTKTEMKTATMDTLVSLRGGGGFPASPKALSTFYSLLYLFHSTVMQYTPSGMGIFYGSVDQDSFHNAMYSSAANSQMGLGILIYLCAVTSREAGRSIGWSFLPYLADAFPLLYYSATQATARTPATKSSPASEGPFDVNYLTIWSLIFGGSSFLILMGSCPAAAQLPAYLATIVGVIGTFFPTQVCKIEGPNIEGNDKSIALYIGRKIILAMHGAYALMVLNGIGAFKALAYLTATFVPIATYLGFVRDTRKKMDVTNVVAWWGWIVSSLVVAIGILLDNNKATTATP
mmetsp:Transcript_17007/g.25237  ORF Transcript_17007/g.25237 Transcript_17007/m.25237 type:complete len:331 (-) Transcript_17007:349-1341(-)|eukprot:CAMPEP_0194038740 /NCGR_PEP_ID=MMETSP0009_2-20130614/10956_1 /TAXON_ID=210454 /ORGANISM="Grammatophora oceanica, Strain CCMP 410" /LENGTH=330 /DNA_ID=CAMNT_0038681341 /DNA_START=25 /DNA_END=1017 /DNA_ORIENTATION=-